MTHDIKKYCLEQAIAASPDKTNIVALAEAFYGFLAEPASPPVTLHVTEAAPPPNGQTAPIRASHHA